MSIVTSQEMFAKAYAGGYAIGAFNVNNMEIIQGITEAAKECNAPVILQVSSGARKYANRTYLVSWWKLPLSRPVCRSVSIWTMGTRSSCARPASMTVFLLS